MSGSQFRAALTEQKLRAFIVERGLEPITNESQIAALSRSQLDEERAEGAALDRGLSSPAPDEDAGRRIDSLSNAIDVKTKFAPTRELLTAWLEAANENLVAAGQPTISLSEALDDRSYYVELGKKIASFFRNYAVRKSYEVERYRITFAGRFLLSIENLVVDRFMLPPRIAVRFLDLLVEQVLAQSKQGEVFFGSWGKLVVDEDGELLLRLERRRPLSLAKLLKAG